MVNPRLYKTEAVILKEARLGEADRILTLFTPLKGKLRAVARGALRPHSKLAGHLQPLSHNFMMLAQGHSLDIVTQCQIIHPFRPLREDLMRMSWALYVVELIDGFCPENLENAALFSFLVETLEQLCQVKDGQRLLRYFEVRLADNSGFRLQLKQCVNCRQPLAPVTNFFNPDSGGLLCPSCAAGKPFYPPLSVTALKVLRLFQQEDLSAVTRLRISPQLAAELEDTMRDYIHYLLEREVKSTAWMTRLRQELGPAP